MCVCVCFGHNHRQFLSGRPFNNQNDHAISNGMNLTRRLGHGGLLILHKMGKDYHWNCNGRNYVNYLDMPFILHVLPNDILQVITWNFYNVTATF